MPKPKSKSNDQNSQRKRIKCAPFIDKIIFLITAVAFVIMAAITTSYCLKNNLQGSFALTSITIAISILVIYWQQKLQKLRGRLKNESKIAEQLRASNRKLQIEISERKRAEDHANMMTRKAQAANEAKSTFLANMSHEIRTPMNAIIGFSDILKDEQINEKQKEYVDVIRSSGGNLLNLINDILDFSKIESGKLDTEIIECSLGQLLSGIENIMQPLAEKKGLELKVLQCGKLPSIIKTDPFRTRQCLINLVNNAIKFTSKGHVYINVSIIECNDKPYIEFAIEDTGIGIDRKQQKDIFKSFTQADRTTTRKFGGTGLGLTITKQLALIMSGDLTVKSVLNQGSVFTLSLPVNIDIDSQSHLDKYQKACSTSAEMGNSQDIQKQGKSTKLKGNILVAEDSKPNQKLVQIFLEKMGLDVAIAENGVRAVDMTINGRFDMILMDIQMPEMNGYQAAKKLRELGVKIPIIALTANALKGDCEKCIRAGCNDYISKPVDQKSLRETIEKHFTQSGNDSSNISLLKSQIDELSELCNQNSFNKSENQQDQNLSNDFYIDWSKAMKYCGDESVIKRIAASILNDVRKSLELLKDNLAQQNYKDVVIYAHKIRGAVLSIGADLVAEKAELIEFAAEKEDPNISIMIPPLANELNKLTDFLSQKDWMEKAKKMSLSESNKDSND